MQNDILFDNIYIGHSVEDARKLAEETFFEKHPVEQLLELADKPKVEEEKPEAAASVKFTEDPVLFVKEKLNQFLTLASQDPLAAVKEVPEVAGGIVAVIVLLLSGVFVLGSGGAAAPAAKTVVTESKSKDKTEASASGVDTGKDGATKRATRSHS